MVLGSGARGVGGMILLYRSPICVTGSTSGPLLQGRIEETGHNWECPNYLRLGDRRLLIFSPRAIPPGALLRRRPGGLPVSPRACTACWIMVGSTMRRRPLSTSRAGGSRSGGCWKGARKRPRRLRAGLASSRCPASSRWATDGDLEQRPIAELAVPALRSSADTGARLGGAPVARASRATHWSSISRFVRRGATSRAGSAAQPRRRGADGDHV